MPHAICWAADPELIWTMVFANAITFLSYSTICITLLLLVRRTGRLIARDWAYFVVGFALFILACGTTHLLEVITTWDPVFWVDAWANILTAGLSGYVAFMLIRRVSKLSFGINDYAARLANTEIENSKIQESLLAARKLEDWSRMSAVVSHEIKNPLQAIQNLQFLIGSSEGVSPQIAELAKMAGEEAQRVLDISESTLAFIRQAPRPEIVDLYEVVNSIRFLLGPIIRKQGIEFQVSRTGNTQVEAYAGETRQVLLNVIRNACESITRSGAGVTVDISGTSPGPASGPAAGVDVVVTDEGGGIDPQILPDLFKFGTTTKGEKGNGMGLWTVKHILDKHAGMISIQSSSSEGTSVLLHWPKSYLGTQSTNATQVA